MFDIGASELLLIVIVAVIVIGPKDMPLALRTAGRWIGKIRRVSSHFRTGLDAMIREAEMEETEKQWRERNERIMAAHPRAEMEPRDRSAAEPGASAGDAPAEPPAAGAEARAGPPRPSSAPGRSDEEPLLPFNGPPPPP